MIPLETGAAMSPSATVADLDPETPRSSIVSVGAPRETADHWTEVLGTVAAQAHACRKLTPQETQAVKRTLKTLAPSRKRCSTPDWPEKAAWNAKQLIEQLRRARPSMGEGTDAARWDLPTSEAVAAGVRGDERTAALLAEKRKLCRLMEEGLSAREAVVRMGLPTTRVRWAQRTYRAFLAGNLRADGRRGRTMPRPVRNPVFQERLRESVSLVGRSGPHAVHAHLYPRWGTGRDSGQLDMGLADRASYSTVKRALRELPMQERIALISGTKEAMRQCRPISTARVGQYGNDRWELDHTMLDAWCMVAHNGEIAPVRPWLSVAIDTYSRRIMGLVVSPGTPNAWTVLKLLRIAIATAGEIHGDGVGLRPTTVVTDNGMDFQAGNVELALTALAVNWERCRPGKPDEKPFVERFMGTVARSFASTLPSGTKNIGTSETAARKKSHLLPDFNAMASVLHAWIDTSYNATRHSGTGEVPLARWQNKCGGEPISLAQASTILLPRVERTVRKEGVVLSFRGVRREYWWAESGDMLGQKVIVALDPDAPRSVLVHDTDGRLVGEATDRRDPEVGLTRELVKDQLRTFRDTFRSHVQAAKAQAKAREAAKRQLEDAQRMVAEAQRLELRAGQSRRDGPTLPETLVELEEYQRSLESWEPLHLPSGTGDAGGVPFPDVTDTHPPPSRSGRGRRHRTKEDRAIEVALESLE